MGSQWVCGCAIPGRCDDMVPIAMIGDDPLLFLNGVDDLVNVVVGRHGWLACESFGDEFFGCAGRCSSRDKNSSTIFEMIITIEKGIDELVHGLLSFRQTVQASLVIVDDRVLQIRPEIIGVIWRVGASAMADLLPFTRSGRPGRYVS